MATLIFEEYDLEKGTRVVCLPIQLPSATQIHEWFARRVATRIAEAGDVFNAGLVRFVLTNPVAAATHAPAMPARNLARVGTHQGEPTL